MKKIHINNNLVSYTEIGNGPSLLLLHGFGVGSEIWEHCIDTLSKKYTVLLLDLPGYGLNKDIAVAPNIESIATFVSEFIQQRGAIEYIVGYSMGGLVVIHALRNQLSSIKKVILVATPIFSSDFNLMRPIFSLIGRSTFLSSVICFLVKRFPIKHMIFIIGGLSSIRKPQAMNECMKKFATGSNMSYAFAWAATLFRLTSLKSSSLPIDLIYGEDDGFAKTSMSKRAMAYFTNSNVHIVKGAYHLIPLEKPDELTRIISDRY